MPPNILDFNELYFSLNQSGRKLKTELVADYNIKFIV